MYILITGCTINGTSPAEYSDTPTTQRLNFRLIKLKICIFIKSAPPLAYQTNCTLTLRMYPPTYKRVKNYGF